MIFLRRFTASLAVLAILYAGLASAALNDVLPADFVALPEGRTTMSFYLYDRQQDGAWTKGQRAGDLHLGSTIAAARLNRFYRLGGWKLAPLVVFSAADMALSGNSVPANVKRERSGLSDLRLGGTLWFIDNPENRHYLGLNLMTVWPTGRYDNNEIANPGENRRRQSLMLGWVRGLSDNLTLELTPEVAWYGINSENYPGNVRLEQRRTLSLTGYLRYRFSPEWQGFIGAQANEGGETMLNEVSQNNPIHGHRYFLGGTYSIDKNNSINLRVAGDASLTTGLKTTREIVLRWGWVH